MRTDLYKAITEQIITAIEAGVEDGSYQLPWHRGGSLSMPVNAVSRQPYHGINTLLLWSSARQAGYSTGEWATYRQWAAAGAQVKKGERASVVLLWKTIGHPDNDADGAHDDHRRQRTLARAFHLFNAAQVDGYTPARQALPLAARIEGADAFFAAQPAEIWHGSDEAFFDPASDVVCLPAFGAFTSAEAYYSVYAHELTHWTGSAKRLERDLSGRFGSAAYAMEELVAELGAAFTLGHLGLAARPRDDHAVYLASWLKVLRDDPAAILTAASRAQLAADYLISLAEGQRMTSDAPLAPASSELVE